jgi:hypothetical protein
MDPLSDHNWFGLQQPPRSWEERKTSNKGLLAQFGHVETDGNKSLYLVFVGVVFLSILDCF